MEDLWAKSFWSQVEGALATSPFLLLSLLPRSCSLWLQLPEMAMSKFFTSIQRTWFAWYWINHFSIISITCLALAPFSARPSIWQKTGLGPQNPALHLCTASVPWILFSLGYSWCEDNLHTLLYSLELNPHFGGGGAKPSKPMVILYFVMTLLWH